MGELTVSTVLLENPLELSGSSCQLCHFEDILNNTLIFFLL